MKTLLDTCALIWWTLDPKELSNQAAKSCQKIKTDGALVSSISIWEVGIKIKNKKLDIGMSLSEYVRRLNKLNTLQFIPVDNRIWIKNIELDWPHRDPADRTIVATAELNEAYIITADKDIIEYYPKTIW